MWSLYSMVTINVILISCRKWFLNKKIFSSQLVCQQQVILILVVLLRKPVYWTKVKILLSQVLFRTFYLKEIVLIIPTIDPKQSSHTLVNLNLSNEIYFDLY